MAALPPAPGRLDPLISAVEGLARHGDLSTRVPQGTGDEEIERLSRSFNQSLERIESMYRALEAVVVKQRRFVADASHELRTPLTTISSCLELVHEFPQMDVAQQRLVLGDALHEAKQMARLVDDLLTLAAMDSGERVARAPFEWNELLASAIADAGPLLSPRTLTTDVASDLGPGNGDVRLLRQLFAILVDNVVAHTPESADVAIGATREPKSGAITVRVSDSGNGVPPEMVGQIFERFVRVDAARHGSAIGLGLTIARAVVVGHGGSIDATRVEPHGLCITAVFPPLLETPDRRRSPRPSRGDG